MQRIAFMFGWFAVLLLFSTQTLAQNDPVAKKILDAADSKLKQITTLQANYSFTVTTKVGMNAGAKTGTVQIKGDKYVMTDKSLQITCDGKTIWRYDPSANKVTVSTVPASDTTFTLIKMFSAFWNKDFAYKLIGNKGVGGKLLAEIELTPTVNNKNFSKVYVYVDQTQNVVSAVKVVEKSGNSLNYLFNNLKINVPIADNQFVFDKSTHPGVEVTNARY